MFSTETASPDGTDIFHMAIPIQTGLAAENRHRLFYRDLDLSEPGTSHWDTLPIQYLWCDSAAWSTPYSARLMGEELDEAKKDSRRWTRDVSMVPLRGSNHFVSFYGACCPAGVFGVKWLTDCSAIGTNQNASWRLSSRRIDPGNVLHSGKHQVFRTL
jgi:hypothetical protein